MPKISSNQNALFSFIAKLEVVKTTSSFTGKNHEFHDLHSIIERDGPRFHEFHRIIDRTITNIHEWARDYKFFCNVNISSKFFSSKHLWNLSTCCKPFPPKVTCIYLLASTPGHSLLSHFFATTSPSKYSDSSFLGFLSVFSVDRLKGKHIAFRG